MLGRRAYTRRNNLFYDYDERIIYVASTQIVQLPTAQESEEKKKLRQLEEENEQAGLHSQKIRREEDEELILLNQRFLQPDSCDPFSTFPEISAIAFGSSS